MSSPIAKKTKSNLEKTIIKSHQKLSHNNRINYLSNLFIGLLDELNLDEISLLDIGCGDMSIAENLMNSRENINAICLDTYPLPEQYKGEEKWEKYVSFDGRTMPFEDKKFDVAILCDVLHHDFEFADVILKEACRVAKYIVVKDHFEYGMVSRQTLRLMDFIGNWGYGVSVPDRYFSKETYQDVLNQLGGVKELKQICPIPLYEHNFLFNLICPGKLQYISILKSA
ncbi:class I SAM-dependent methyltransferase [Aureispira sp. CCB-E]|uniref:class I SAM-dependent methyltransferase n=1 Tax=Aureispira sp. CCB-E TaxID=3051121 RepID=UPI0028690E0F|nr:class I SAM-dependent methyltransferase [Aureispira sp. CCB-E]WMX12488.1 class I SAM-dependent methyltransferase [Aureispira sp. CCB-E]